MNDLRFACRQLLKNPGFTAVAVLTLALGIGACTAIFSVVNCVLFRPLAYPQAEQLMVLEDMKLPEIPRFAVAPGNYFDWREQAQSFDHLAAVRGTSYNLTGLGEPVRVAAQRITPNYFTMLRASPLLGRVFSDEEAAAKANLAVLSHGFWLRQFGGRPDVVGESVQLNGRVFTILGVMPVSFQTANHTELYTPLDYAEDRQIHGNHTTQVIGRLKPGIAVEQARQELTAIATRLEKQYPDTNAGWRVRITPLFDHTVGYISRVLYPLLGAVGFLLLLACANVANLLLARATARAKELTIRSALGATRGRLVRQLLAESILLAMLGGALGILIAKGGMSILLAAMPDGLPRASEIVLDGGALGFTWVLAMLTGVSFGLVPALQASRAALNETLKDGTRGTNAGRGRLLGALVVVEVAIALVLLAGGGLLIRSFLRLQEVEPGFQPRDAFIASLELPGDRYRSPAQQAAFAADATARLGAIPGVQSVGAANLLPYSGTDFNLIFSIVGRPPVPAGTIQSTLYYEVTPDYFKAMGVPLRRGRFFTPADDAAAPRVAIINEMMAKRFFPDEDPIGKRIKVTDAEAEIVGVVANVQQYDPTGDIRPQTYEPFAQVPFSIMSFVVRITPPRPGESGSAATATALVAAIRAAIHAIDKDQPIASVRPLADPVASSVARPRFAALIFAGFSGVALLLAAIGIYGVLAYTVNQRANEIGIRMALGAQRGDVLGLVLGQGGRLVALGLVIGLAGALGLTRFLSALLFGVTAHDPFTFAVIAGLLAMVATLACLIPARRATRIDPAVMLRSR